MSYGEEPNAYTEVMDHIEICGKTHFSSQADHGSSCNSADESASSLGHASSDCLLRLHFAFKPRRGDLTRDNETSNLLPKQTASVSKHRTWFWPETL
ncbi:hypothetical protein BaRGS_00002242 [Batillaria attramentaria]|uniref:Uncharacterized protein n=1 Tax=Batillaria attramentaria TaxID=370345 RepID=A0ABD0M5I6_9CAEN